MIMMMKLLMGDDLQLGRLGLAGLGRVARVGRVRGLGLEGRRWAVADAAGLGAVAPPALQPAQVAAAARQRGRAGRRALLVLLVREPQQRRARALLVRRAPGSCNTDDCAGFYFILTSHLCIFSAYRIYLCILHIGGASIKTGFSGNHEEWTWVVFPVNHGYSR